MSVFLHLGGGVERKPGAIWIPSLFWHPELPVLSLQIGPDPWPRCPCCSGSSLKLIGVAGQGLFIKRMPHASAAGRQPLFLHVLLGPAGKQARVAVGGSVSS